MNKQYFAKYLPVEGEIKPKDKVIWEKQTYASEEGYEKYIGKIYELDEPFGLGLGMIILKDFYPKKSYEEIRNRLEDFLKRREIQKTEEQIHNNTLKNVETSGDLSLKVGYNISEHDIKRVKLFLCSRDIQVGDEITYLIHSGVLKESAIGLYEFIDKETEGIVYLYKENLFSCFKIIGEISSEDTWIKEGDEFNLTDFNPLSAAAIEHKKPLTEPIRIKCPTCKNFH